MKTTTPRAKTPKAKTPKAVIEQTIEATAPSPAKKLSKAQQAKVDKLFGKQPIQDDVQQAMDTPVEHYRLAEEQRKNERRKPNAMDFAVQQLGAPRAPKLTTPQAITQKVVETVDKVRTPKLQQNGESKPGVSTIGCRIWDEIDRVTLELGRPATIQDLRTDANLQNELPINVQSIYARWRRFNGIKGRASNLTIGEYEGLTPIK
jgi:hypothetical protein